MATKKNSPAIAGSNPTNRNDAIAAAAEGGPTMVESRNTATPALVARELHIKIWHDFFAEFEGFAEFKGSAAQLRAEGLIPDDFEWPRNAADEHWQANGCSYQLRRTRPAGWKGPMRSWFEVDNWTIRVLVSDRNGVENHHRGLARKSVELRAARERWTQAGMREAAANVRRYFAARNDKAFQAFKALIPGLIRPKRGRKAETTTSGVAQ